MSPPPGLCQAQHRWEGERRARSRHPCPASAPHSPPLASARGPRLHRRRHLCAPGRVPQGAQPRDPCHHRSRPGAPSAPPPPQLPPPPSGLLRDPEPGRLGGQQVALLPPAPRGPSAAPPAPPSPAQPGPALRGATPLSPHLLPPHQLGLRSFGGSPLFPPPVPHSLLPRYLPLFPPHLYIFGSVPKSFCFLSRSASSRRPIYLIPLSFLYSSHYPHFKSVFVILSPQLTPLPTYPACFLSDLDTAPSMAHLPSFSASVTRITVDPGRI